MEYEHYAILMSISNGIARTNELLTEMNEHLHSLAEPGDEEEEVSAEKTAEIVESLQQNPPRSLPPQGELHVSSKTKEQ